MFEWNGKRFSIITSEEKSTLKLIKSMGDQLNFVTDTLPKIFKDYMDKLKEKTNIHGDHKGSWQGLDRPTLSDEGMRSTVEKHIKDIDELNSNKVDVRKELLQTATANNIFLTLDYDANYPVLQGGCFSDDGTYFFCYMAERADIKGVILKYTCPTISDFNTWKLVKKSEPLNLSHGNDLTYYDGKIYVVNTNASPELLHIISPSSLEEIGKVTLEYGATALTYNKKLNMFITRRKLQWNTYDYYDTDFNYIKSVEPFLTNDTVQGIDSDNDYIYAPMSDVTFGNTFSVFDLKGNFVRRMGCNVMDEVEMMCNIDNHYICGFYANGKNYLGYMTFNTTRRLTSSRYVYNQGRNIILYQGEGVSNGTIPIKYSKRYFTHLSFALMVDGVECETKIIDLTDNENTHIINSFRVTGTGQAIMYRSLLNVANDKEIRLTPFAYHSLNTDGTQTIKLYSNEPEYFNNANSLGISKLRGQILCNQEINMV